MYTLPALPYAFDALEPYIDAKTMEIHHGKHHASYVQNLNLAVDGTDLMNRPIEDLLRHLTDIPESIRSRVRNHGGGHANHSLFWSIMAPSSNALKSPTGVLMSAINSVYGNIDAFRAKFSQAALGRFGSGWAWLVVADGKVRITDTGNQDSPVSNGEIPILGLDVWEHAYYLKYQNLRAEYIQQWWNVVNWKEVEHRYAAAVGR